MIKSKRKHLIKLLNEHSAWVLSQGKEGKLADFKNWKLDKTDLKTANLPFAKLQFVSLRAANLSGINFQQADLLKSSFIGAHLDGADLAGANLSGCDLSFSKCMGANFADANLEGATFEGANLKETTFIRAILRGVDFKGANLSSSEMIDASLEGANFERANLNGINFGGANLDKANFEETDLRGLNTAHEDTKFSSSIMNETKSPKNGLSYRDFDKTTLNRKSSILLLKEDLFVDSNAINTRMIEKAVSELIEKVISNVEISEVKALCKHKHGLEKIDKINFDHGDIVTHNGQVAFKLDYKISYNVSLLLDRTGKLITKSNLKG